VKLNINITTTLAPRLFKKWGAFYFMIEIIVKLVFLFALGTIIIYDIKCYRIPDLLIICIVSISLFKIYINYSISNLLSSLIVFFGFLLLYCFFPKGIGFGDVKLAGAIGLFLGFRLTILALLLSFFSGAIFGLLLIALGKKTMKDPIPFGPFLAFGAIFSMFLGEYIIDWYMNLFI
jgi:leader peptidase (prepilin peptidase)/N-methyltransferase